MLIVENSVMKDGLGVETALSMADHVLGTGPTRFFATKLVSFIS